MDMRTLLTSVGVAIAVSTVVVSIANFIPFRPEFDRLKRDMIRRDNVLKIADSESEIRRREENICALDNEDVIEYRLCMEHYERERDVRLRGAI